MTQRAQLTGRTGMAIHDATEVLVDNVIQANPGCSWMTKRTILCRRSCKLRGCVSKARNGRCVRSEVHLEVDSSGQLTGRCRDFQLRTLGRIRR